VAACVDAGLPTSAIDGIVRADYDYVAHNDLVEAARPAHLTYWGVCGPGGIAPSGLIGQAVGAIMSGQATTVPRISVPLNGRTGVRYGAPEVGARVGGHNTYDEFYSPYGLVSAAQRCTRIMARRHSIEFGTTAEDLGAIAIACRNGPMRIRPRRCTASP